MSTCHRLAVFFGGLPESVCANCGVLGSAHSTAPCTATQEQIGVHHCPRCGRPGRDHAAVASARAIGLSFDPRYLSVELADGRVIMTPISWYPRLAGATLEMRADYRLIEDGAGVYWPQIDEHLSVAGMLAGRPARPAPGASKRDWLVLSDAGLGAQSHVVADPVAGILWADATCKKGFLQMRTACGHWTTTPVDGETLRAIDHGWRPEDWESVTSKVVSGPPMCEACRAIGDFPVNGRDGLQPNVWRQIRAWIGPDERVWVSRIEAAPYLARVGSAPDGGLVIAVEQAHPGPQQKMHPVRLALFSPDGQVVRRWRGTTVPTGMAEVARRAAGRLTR